MRVSERRLIPISVGALITGVLYEGLRLSEKWRDVLLVSLASFVLSFSAFLPGKGKHIYNFDHHIEIWPYYFIFLFILISIIFHGDKIVARLTEGITLLQSIAVIYWVTDHDFIATENLFFKLLMVLGFLFSLFSVFHAFTYTQLSATNRLILSIWSSVIMMLFALDNIYRVYQNEQVENTVDITHGFYVALQYFLLGVSSIYIAQNILMVTSFLPGKGTFFNSKYYSELKALKNDHIKRYSEKQVSIPNSLFCLLFTGGLFFLNYHYQLLPRHTAIWATFVIFPFVLDLYSALSRART